MKDFLFFVGLPLSFLIGLILLAMWLDNMSCSAKTKGIGEYTWGPIQGCLVKPEGAKNFIPLENYRVI